MYVGTQLQARSDDDYRVFAQLGVNHICGYPPGPPTGWTAEHLTKYREHVESFGLKLSAEDGYVVYCALPKGAFATSLIRELTRVEELPNQRDGGSQQNDGIDDE